MSIFLGAQPPVPPKPEGRGGGHRGDEGGRLHRHLLQHRGSRPRGVVRGARAGEAGRSHLRPLAANAEPGQQGVRPEPTGASDRHGGLLELGTGHLQLGEGDRPHGRRPHRVPRSRDRGQGLRHLDGSGAVRGGGLATSRALPAPPPELPRRDGGAGHRRRDPRGVVGGRGRVRGHHLRCLRGDASGGLRPPLSRSGCTRQTTWAGSTCPGERRGRSIPARRRTCRGSDPRTESRRRTTA